MTTVQEARRIIKEHPLSKKVKQLSLEEAYGLVLAEDILACLDVPRFDNSAMDGYALSSGGFSSFKIKGEIKAGDGMQWSLGQGEAVRIMTGAMIPRGTYAVVMREFAREEKENLLIETEISHADHIRRRGEEIKAGEVALTRGKVLNPPALSYLASVGVDSVLVFNPPAVSIIVTGNELVHSVEELKPGYIIDSNTLTLKTALKQAGIQEIYCFRAQDDPVSLREVITQALEKSDSLLISGGVSVGDWDFSKNVLRELGMNELFWRVAQKPGKPLLFGRKGRKTLFGLPGNPAAVLVCFYEYVYPHLREAMGFNPPQLKTVTARFIGEEKKKTELVYFARAELFIEEHEPHVRLVEGQESFRLGSFAKANALAVLPEGKKEVREGEKIEVHLLP